MRKLAYLIIVPFLLFIACEDDEPSTSDNGIPVVKADSTYPVLMQEDISYAEGLKREAMSPGTEAVPLLLDVYYPDNTSLNRPLCMFIHGGGFQGGTKAKPEIVEMANYYTSRGFVFASIDYRTTEELGVIQGMTPEAVVNLYKGIAPQEWIDFSIQNAEAPDEVLTSMAMYAAQRDAKAALRWIVANAEDYKINTDYITVGGASAGSISAITLGISDQEDFRDEVLTSDDPTLSTTNLEQTYEVKSMIYFWGSKVKLELHEAIYGVDKFDSNDPELFMAHGTEDSTTLYSEATELVSIYDSIGVYQQLFPLEGAGHGAWNATVEGKSLFDLSFDFLVERQNLNIE